MNKSIKDIQGSVLIISQFTLYASCKRGGRLDVAQSARPEKAKALYEEYIHLMKKENITVQTGIFAAKMQIELVNEGPVTINLEFWNFIRSQITQIKRGKKQARQRIIKISLQREKEKEFLFKTRII